MFCILNSVLSTVLSQDMHQKRLRIYKLFCGDKCFALSPYWTLAQRDGSPCRPQETLITRSSPDRSLCVRIVDARMLYRPKLKRSHHQITFGCPRMRLTQFHAVLSHLQPWIMLPTSQLLPLSAFTLQNCSRPASPDKAWLRYRNSNFSSRTSLWSCPHIKHASSKNVFLLCQKSKQLL